MSECDEIMKPDQREILRDTVVFLSIIVDQMCGVCNDEESDSEAVNRHEESLGVGILIGSETINFRALRPRLINFLEKELERLKDAERRNV